MEMKTYRKYKGIYLHMLIRKKNVGFIVMYTVAGAIVSVDHFNNYVKNMHGDRDQQFENEYSVSQCAANGMTVWGQIKKSYDLKLKHADNQ